MPAVLSKMIMRVDYETVAKSLPCIIKAGDVSRGVKVPTGSVRSWVLGSLKEKKPTMSFEDYMVSHGIEGELIYAARVLVHTLPPLHGEENNGSIVSSETISKISGCDIDVLTCWCQEEECQGFSAFCDVMQKHFNSVWLVSRTSWWTGGLTVPST